MIETTRATTIYNRAGTAHLWYAAFMSSNPHMMRSYCGLFEDGRHLDRDGATRDCKRCAIASKTEK